MKYKFNYKSLSFEKEVVTLKKRLGKLILYLLTGISFAVLTIFIHSKIFISPKEKQLLRELEETEMQIDIINKRVDLLSNVLQGMEYKDDNLYRVLLEAEPIQNRNITIENLLLDNSHSKNYSKTLKELSRKVDILTARSQVQLESYKQLWELSEKKKIFMLQYRLSHRSKIQKSYRVLECVIILFIKYYADIRALILSVEGERPFMLLPMEW